MTRRSTLTATETAFVQRQRVARLATADENGTPSLVPVCYAFDGTHFYIALDEKPKSVAPRRLRRVRNIEARHAATLLIDQYTDDWSQLGYILLQGHAELIFPSDALHPRALHLLRERYRQYLTMALEQYPVIVITPQQVTTWGPAVANAEA